MEMLEALTKKISTIENLKSVVRTMKSLSAVSIRQYETAEAAIAEYHRTIELGLQVVLRANPQITKPARDSGGPVGIIVFGSDYGLCGRFNALIADFTLSNLDVERIAHHDCHCLAVGTRVMEKLEVRGLKPQNCFRLPSTANGLAGLGSTLILEIDKWRERNECERVLMFYNRREAMQRSAPKMTRLLPIDERYLNALARHPWEARGLPTFTMDADVLLSALLRQHLFMSIFRAGAESLAAEHAARLASMHYAERNIAENLDEMNAEHRRIRQDAITFEIQDIVAGYEVLGAGRRKH